jgi:hypothetical protein
VLACDNTASVGLSSVTPHVVVSVGGGSLRDRKIGTSDY